jgi:signal transduction histidine kinase
MAKKYKAKFLDYFEKENRSALSVSQALNESYFINFSFIATSALMFFIIANAAVGFWEAVAINFIGVSVYIIGLFVYKKSDSYYLPMAILIANCSYILFGQHVILQADAFHNMLFFPALSVFTFALIDRRRLLFTFLVSISLTAIAAHFAVKYFGTTVKVLTPEEKDMYVVLCIVASIYCSYQIVKVLYEQRRNAYKELDEKNAQLIELNERNKQLLAVLTHDIANPLSVISTSMQLIRKSKDKEEIIQRLQDKFLRAEKSIIDIINNARKMLAIEDGKIQVNMQDLELKEVITEVIGNFEYKLSAKGLSSEIVGLDDQLMVQADPSALKTSVLSNIISNAIKFSKNNGVIKVEVIPSSTYVSVKITDSGIGMPERIKEKVFDPHAKTSRAGTDGEKGTGYGMPLAKSYLGLMGGNIECFSEEGIGTTFQFTLKKA